MMEEIRAILPGGWISLIIVIILGAIGSATWDVVFRPFFIKFRNLTLSFFTLWKENLRNNLYSQISFGSSRQHLSIFSSELLIFFLTVLLTIGMFYIKSATYDAVVKTHNETLSLKERVINIDKKADTTIDKEAILKELKEHENQLSQLIEGSFWFVTLSGGFVLFFFGYQISNLSRNLYIHSATSYLDRLFNIMRPYTLGKEYIQYKSMYAQIENKQDFVDLINKLYDLAEEKDLKYKKFQPW